MTIDQRIERAVSVMTEACRSCEGDGYDYDRDYDEDGPVYLRFECRSCHGTGEHIEEDDTDA